MYCKLLRKNEQVQVIHPGQVRHTSDHGLLYEQKQYYRKANFLFESAPVALLFKRSKRRNSWYQFVGGLYEQSKVVVIDLTRPRPTNGLHVVKVFVPGLVPMQFGYSLEPCGMTRIQTAAAECLYLNARWKGFLELNHFPHPFT